MFFLYSNRPTHSQYTNKYEPKRKGNKQVKKKSVKINEKIVDEELTEHQKQEIITKY